MRLAFVWANTNLDRLEGGEPPDPFAFLGEWTRFAPRFEFVRDGSADNDGLLAPWGQKGVQGFWRRYLENRDPRTITGRLAWKSIVPFRWPLPIRVSAQWLPGRASIEAFLYPHGYGIVIDIRVSPDSVDLPTAVDLAQRIRHAGAFSVEASDGVANEKLETLADRARDWVRSRIYRDGGPADAVIGDPFNVISFVQMRGVDLWGEVESNDDVHRALEGVTSFRATWKADALPALTTAQVEQQKTPGHVLYAARRARAIWFPEPAAYDRPTRRTIACYHRNQTFAALQVESLAGLIKATNTRLAHGGDLSPRHDDLSRYAAGILGRLYSGRDTYRSRSCRRHIADNSLVDEIDSLRNRWPGMSPIVR